jgi:hypothetical protein
MVPLTLDDLLPLPEYAARRPEYFQAHCRYLDRYRRVRVGPRVTLLFENRQTLWFRVQEVIRVARLSELDRLKQELDLYNRLLPDRDVLQAAFLIEVTDESRLAEELASWQALRGDDLSLYVADRRYPAHLVTCRPEDRAIGAAHWVQFRLDTAARKRFADFDQPALCEITLATYRHRSALLNDEVRQSLLDDLQS